MKKIASITCFRWPKITVKALPDLIRAIVRPVQSDFLLAVAEEGTDARPDMTPQEFFFEGLIQGSVPAEGEMTP